MKIIDKKNSEIIDDTNLNSKFISVQMKQLDLNCNILKDDFYSDSFNYFPITEDLNTFSEAFSWGEKMQYEKFYNKNFVEEFTKNKQSFRSLSEIYILGSSPGNNYYRNLITFLPRLFFIHGVKVKLAIHRNLTNKFKNFIKYLCNKRGIKVQFVFLDDEFYSFKNSQIPSFLSYKDSFKILNSLKELNSDSKNKIYLSRQKSSYRNLINEGDIIDILKKKGFRIIDLNDLSVFDQINLFSSASVIVSPTGSSLANIVFCNPETKIIEIIPRYNHLYENAFKLRYSSICKELALNYFSVMADPVELDKIDNNAKTFIHSKFLNESNYYKNLLLKIKDIQKII